MSIEWTDEAVQAFDREYASSRGRTNRQTLCNSLDAAVKAQGIKQQADSSSYFECGVTHGRAEAFEEAAKYHERRVEEIRTEIRLNREYYDYCQTLIVAKGEHEDSAAAIRALAKEPPK